MKTLSRFVAELTTLIVAVLSCFDRVIFRGYLRIANCSSLPTSVAGIANKGVWVYYSSQILFFGAEFAKVYADEYGSRIVAAEGAEPVTDEARAEQGIPRADKPRAEPPGRKN
jgi:membrane protein